MPQYRHGPPPSSPFEAGSLPLEEKERLCRELLAEFGVAEVTERSNHELNFSCCLPFGSHKNGDQHPSANLNYEKLTFICWGCQSSGGLLWFIGTCRGSTGEEARTWINSKTGLGHGLTDLPDLMAEFDRMYSSRERRSSAPMPRMDAKVLARWRFIHPYMTEVRGIPEETLIRFRVGWDPERNRIVIPLFWEDYLRGWQARRLIDDGTPKYLNSPDFPRAETLYNFPIPCRRGVVVESPMSVLSKHHLEPGIVATMGANVTERQIHYLSGLDQVVLFLDNDNAGWKATEQLGDALSPYMQVSVVENPYNADPADLDDYTFRRLVDDAVPYALWSRPNVLVEWGGVSDVDTQVRVG